MNRSKSKWNVIIYIWMVIISNKVFAQQWNILQSGGVYDFWDVEFSGPNNGYIIGENGTVMHSTDGLIWINKNSGNNYFLKGIDIKGDNVYISGDADPTTDRSFILKSNDNGQNWSTNDMNGASITYDMYDVDFLNDSVGYAVGENAVITDICSGGNCPLTVHYTTDYGATWSGRNFTYLGSTVTKLRDIEIVNDNLAYLAGNQNKIFKSTNPSVPNSSTWLDISDNTMPSNSLYRDICFLNNDTGFVAGNTGTSGLLLKTTDGGTTWDSSMFSNRLFGVRFFNPQIGYVVGESGFIAKTNDGGASWTTDTSGTTEDLRDVFILNDSVAIAVGTNGILLTTDKPKITLGFVFDSIVCKNEVVAFDNVSLNADSFNWYVDGVLTAADSLDFNYTFTSAGYHEIKLIGYNTTSSGIDSLIKSVLIVDTLTAAFTLAEDTILPGGSVQVTNTSIESYIDAYKWVLDEAIISTAQNLPEIVLFDTGHYDLKLIVSMNNCVFDTSKTITIVVRDTADIPDNVIAALPAGYISVYPNPSDGIINIDLSGVSQHSDNMILAVNNMMGQQIYKAELSNLLTDKKRIISIEKPGLYTLSVQGTDFIYAKLIVIENK